MVVLRTFLQGMGVGLGLLSVGCATRTPAVSAPSATTVATASAAESTAILQRHVEAHMRFLASDALNGRGSGTRDEWIAATYIGSQLAALGLEPMGDDGWFVQRIEVQRYAVKGTPTLTAGGQTFSRGEDFIARALRGDVTGGSLVRHVPGTPAPAGSVVVLAPDAPRSASQDASRAALVLRKASNAEVASWNAPNPRASQWVGSEIVGLPPNTRPAGPVQLTLHPKAYDAIAAMADGTRVELKAERVPAERTQTWNVVGRLPGSDPTAATENIVVSAHLDHIGALPARDGVADVINNGADDDASGVTAVLELARALSSGPRPRRPIVFALFGSEEGGGFGAGYFVDRPVLPLTNIIADLQIEMIGRPDPKVPPGTLWLTGYDRSTLGQMLADRGARLVADPHPEQNFFERSDNIRFARRGVVAHTVSSYGLHTEYHTPADEIRHIDFTHMTQAIASLVEPVRWLATTTDKPTWVEGRMP